MINVHPFPARMAPDLALSALESLRPGNIVLDPMTGSGTVLQQAQDLGLSALGFDLDPLAVLISRVGTRPVSDGEIEEAGVRLLSEARSLRSAKIELPWIDGDNRTKDFVEYWFGKHQRKELRRLAYVLSRPEVFGICDAVADVLRVALSRIIVTKSSAASLAQDTSHSRPHRVRTESNYNVLAGYSKSITTLRKRIAKIPPRGQVLVGQGDARHLREVADESVDMVLTSPPYLNAIDYMRGHKMSLVWLGFPVDQLTKRRSESIGSERHPDPATDLSRLEGVISAMGDTSLLPSRHQGMIKRYAHDLTQMLGEVARVLKHEATATFVMGNSCLKGVFIENSAGLIEAATQARLELVGQSERTLPNSSRYLPTPTSGSLSKRMRKEVIVRLLKA